MNQKLSFYEIFSLLAASIANSAEMDANDAAFRGLQAGMACVIYERELMTQAFLNFADNCSEIRGVPTEQLLSEMKSAIAEFRSAIVEYTTAEE